MLDSRREGGRKKFPRLFLALNETGVPVPDLVVALPDRGSAAVLDISEAGILISPTPALAKMKVGEGLEIKLRIGALEPKVLHVKLLRTTPQAILLGLDVLTVGGRLRLEQEERESLIRRSWHPQPLTNLPSTFAGGEWWHAVFDTNLWIWRDSAKTVRRFTLEFESIALVYDEQGLRFLKTPPAFDESKGYAGPLSEPLPNKVEPGFGWKSRLAKVMEAPVLPGGLWDELRAFLPNMGARNEHV